MILKVEQTLKHAKTTEKNFMCECIFHHLAVKNVNINLVKIIYCQRNLIFLRQKKYTIHYLTGQNRGLSSLKKLFGRSSWPATCCLLFSALGSVRVWLTRSGQWKLGFAQQHNFDWPRAHREGDLSFPKNAILIGIHRQLYYHFTKNFTSLFSYLQEKNDRAKIIFPNFKDTFYICCCNMESLGPFRPLVQTGT